MSDVFCPVCRDVPSQNEQSGVAGRPLHRLTQHQVNVPLHVLNTLLGRKLTKSCALNSYVEIIFLSFLSCCLSVDLKGSWELQRPSLTALGGSLQPLDLKHPSDIPCPPLSALHLNQHPHLEACRGKNCDSKALWMSNLCYGIIIS